MKISKIIACAISVCSAISVYGTFPNTNTNIEKVLDAAANGRTAELLGYLDQNKTAALWQGQWGDHALLTAVSAFQLDTVRVLLKDRRDIPLGIDKSDFYCRTSVMKAVMEGTDSHDEKEIIEILQLLKDRGAEFNYFRVGQPQKVFDVFSKAMKTVTPPPQTALDMVADIPANQNLIKWMRENGAKTYEELSPKEKACNQIRYKSDQEICRLMEAYSNRNNDVKQQEPIEEASSSEADSISDVSSSDDESRGSSSDADREKAKTPSETDSDDEAYSLSSNSESDDEIYKAPSDSESHAKTFSWSSDSDSDDDAYSLSTNPSSDDDSVSVPSDLGSDEAASFKTSWRSANSLYKEIFGSGSDEDDIYVVPDAPDAPAVTAKEETTVEDKTEKKDTDSQNKVITSDYESQKSTADAKSKKDSDTDSQHKIITSDYESDAMK